MPAGLNKHMIFGAFHGVDMPATLAEIEKINPFIQSFPVRMILENGVNYEYVHQEGSKYWMSENLLAERIESFSKELKFLKKQQRSIARASKK